MEQVCSTSDALFFSITIEILPCKAKLWVQYVLVSYLVSTLAIYHRSFRKQLNEHLQKVHTYKFF